jgi:hypothetical protein
VASRSNVHAVSRQANQNHLASLATLLIDAEAVNEDGNAAATGVDA